jgi:hypothetical protein
MPPDAASSIKRRTYPDNLRGSKKNHPDRMIIIEDQAIVQKIEAYTVDATLSSDYAMLQLLTAWRYRICEGDSTARLL